VGGYGASVALCFRFPRPLAFVVSFLLVLVVAVQFFLTMWEAVRRMAATAVSYQSLAHTAGRDPHAVRDGVDRDVRRYLIKKMLLSAIMGVAEGDVLWLFGVELAVVFGLPAIGFWGLVWGIVGAFLAVPLALIIRRVSLKIDVLRSLGGLLGGRIPDIETPHSEK